ncbi:hypothetical protein ACIBIZ_40255 [Nonomuraea spiralis]|uniref:hypothetical protein n=1 Tax=Nonomuraea spiralis TaxID=46182 RepID=UPI00379A7DF3
MTSESLNTWASTMAGTTPTMLHMENTPARASSSRPARPVSEPPRIQGRRMPYRPAVRSDRWPETGLAITVATPPRALTRPRVVSLPAGAISWIFSPSPRRRGSAPAAA